MIASSVHCFICLTYCTLTERSVLIYSFKIFFASKNSFSSCSQLQYYDSIVSNVDNSASIYPPPPLKRKASLKSSQNNLLNGGQMPSKHYTNQNNYIYSPLAKHSEFYFEEKVWISSELFVIFSKVIWVKYFLYSALSCRKFRLNTASRNIGFYSHARTTRYIWPIRSSRSRMTSKITHFD